MSKRKLIKCTGNVSVNVCNLKKDDILILNIPDSYASMQEYENISSEALRLSNSLERDLGFKVPVLVLAGDVSFKTMNKEELLDIINR